MPGPGLPDLSRLVYLALTVILGMAFITIIANTAATTVYIGGNATVGPTNVTGASASMALLIPLVVIIAIIVIVIAKIKLRKK